MAIKYTFEAYLVFPSLHSTQPSSSENLSWTLRMSYIPRPSRRMPLRRHEWRNSTSFTEGSGSRGMASGQFGVVNESSEVE